MRLHLPRLRTLVCLLLCTLPLSVVRGQTPDRLSAQPSALSAADSPLQQYFAARVTEAESRTRRDLENPATWLERAPALRKELLGMLGLDPMPLRGDLKPVVTGRLEHEDFTVEKLHFQSLPGLYVTGNLYLPKRRSGKLPAVLYVCGHSVMKEGNVSLGNKTGYQHHPAWFARNGFACLAIDTIQLGEIPGLHHGTRNLDLWWWNSRGYTPAGVETWNGVRALDYLSSREEIDPERLGVTGRSGGGAYSWYIAAVDERVKAAVPVAGITDLRNHVVDNVIDGHCDCMFLLNTRGWDFSKLAALVAPRPLLIANTDKDPIFPVDGVERIHRDVASIYRGLGAKDKLGLLITEGPHKDNQELQAPAFRWFKRFLDNAPDYPAPVAEKLFPPAKLRVFEELPKDERTSTTHEWFVPPASSGAIEGGSSGRLKAPSAAALAAELRKTVFPRLAEATAVWRMVSRSRSGARTTALLAASTEPADRPGTTPALLLSGTKSDVEALVVRLLPAPAPGSAAPAPPTPQSANPAPSTPDGKPALSPSPSPLSVQIRVRFGDRTDAAQLLAQNGAPESSVVEAVLMARGSAMTGPEGFEQPAWSGTEKDAARVRRRFMLLGETLDSVHVRDQVCVVDALARATSERIEVTASGPAATNALLAALLTANPLTLRVETPQLSLTEKTSPDHFNLLRQTTLQALQTAAQSR
jgi:dienelactone hydrolase